MLLALSILVLMVPVIIGFLAISSYYDGEEYHQYELGYEYYYTITVAGDMPYILWMTV